MAAFNSTRREFLKTCGAGAMALGAPGCIALSSKSSSVSTTTSGGGRKPNILLILSDQHRAQAMGFRGVHPIRTPHMDRLAAGGISFDRCITPDPLCTPARCSMFTGLYPHQARGQLPDEPGYGMEQSEMNWGGPADMLRNGTSLREQPILTNLLRQHGYAVGYAGKWHLGSDVMDEWFDVHRENDSAAYRQWCFDHGLPDGKGWSDPRVRSRRFPNMSMPTPLVNEVDADHYEDAWLCNQALAVMQQLPGDKPFFMTCGFEGPHPPFKIPEPYFSMYDPDSIPEPPNFQPTRLEPDANQNNFYRQLWQDYGTDWKSWQKAVAVYWGFVTLIDDQIGRLLNHLEQQGQLDNTLVIYASDHGEMLGQHGLWHKMHAYEESLRVPLIFSAPWIKPGTRCSQAASLIDLPSTILSQAGLTPPAQYQGQDLSAAFDGRGRMKDRPYLFSEFRNLGRFHHAVDWRMATDGRYKYTWNRGDRDELYDLQTDPCETLNLIADPQHGDVLADLRRALGDWMTRTGEPLLGEYEAEVRQSV